MLKEKQIFFSATVQKSPMSIPARVMTEHQLDRVVYFILRGGTEAQREELHELLEHVLLDWHPILNRRHPRRMRDLIICAADYRFSDVQHLQSYQQVLQHVLGEKRRIAVRILHRSAEEGSRYE